MLALASLRSNRACATGEGALSSPYVAAWLPATMDCRGIGRLFCRDANCQAAEPYENEPG
jgi:hypothetical protein